MARLASASVIACACLLATASVRAEAGLACRAQVVFSCRPDCKGDTGPADLVLDFARKSGMFCRGERCDRGILAYYDENGLWNGLPHRVFSLRGQHRRRFQVAGVLLPGHQAFSATSDELGQLAGSCTPR